MAICRLEITALIHDPLEMLGYDLLVDYWMDIPLECPSRICSITSSMVFGDTDAV